MNRHIIFGGLAILAICTHAHADPPTPLSALAKLPVKEITIFKDGHAFVLHQGTLPTDGAGNVQMDYLPTPVLGTFWPYSSDRNVKLTAVTSSPRKALVEKTALTIPDLLAANRLVGWHPIEHVGVGRDGVGKGGHLRLQKKEPARTTWVRGGRAHRAVVSGLFSART